ncbi:MAG: CHASE2 domain-containing protein, partial [Gammaproteobacteria bacterium]|nr:CHASE2 domain-containing protein [Gammaproteobacteria bacterium]
MNTSILLKGRVLVLAVAAVFLAGSFTPSFQALERGAYAAATRVLPSADVSEAVAVVGIDRAALAGIGPWPWSRDRVAATIDRLRVLGARAVGVVLPLEHAETPPGLEALVEEARGSRRGLSGSLKKWAATLDTDRELARAMLAQGRVVIVAEFRPAAGAADASAPSAIWSMKVAEHGLLAALWGPPAARAVNVRGPLPALAGQAAAVGVITDPRADQSQVSMPLALRAGDRAVPGLVTALAALAGGASPGQWEVLPGKGVRIGKRVVVAPDLELRPLALPAAGESSRIAEFSVAELWQSGRIERALRGKTVLLGFTDASLTPLLDVPGRRDVAPVTWLAHGVGSLIEDSRIRMPAWFYAVQRLLVVALAALLLLVPPRWHGRGGAVLTLACAFLMLNAELVMLLIRQLWLPLGLPAAFLVVLQVVLWIRRAFAAWAGRRLDEVAAARRELGMSLKGQGRLDDAFTEYRRSPPRTAILEPLYELGLAYESRRQFAKAAAVYAYADCVRPAFRDVRDRLARLKKVQAGIPLAPVGGGGAGNRTVILNDSGIENPTLAHYRLERELGRGAMAVVYLATDEKLGRKVAVKALALTEEFEGEALEEAQARFRREAEAAARLN